MCYVVIHGGKIEQSLSNGDTHVFTDMPSAMSRASCLTKKTGKPSEIYQLCRKVTAETKVVVEEFSGKMIRPMPEPALREGELQ